MEILSTSFDTGHKIGDRKILTGFNTFDTKSLIEAALSVKLSKIVKINDKIKVGNEKIDAINKLESLTNKFRETLDGFRNMESDSSVSLKKTVNIYSGTSSSDNSLTVIANNNAKVDKFEIKVIQIAAGKVQGSEKFDSDQPVVNNIAGSESNKFDPGVFNLNGADITLNPGDKLADIQNKINSRSEETNVIAEIVNQSPNKQVLILSSTLTGAAGDYAILDNDNILNNLLNKSILKSPVNAKFEYKGLEVERPCNKISDFKDDITIELNEETPINKRLTIEVRSGSAAIEEHLKSFIDTYNELMEFIQRQQLRGADGRYLNSSVLGNERILSFLSYGLTSLVTSTIRDDANNVFNLADIGIKIQHSSLHVGGKEDNTRINLLQLDEKKFKELLDKKPDDIRKVFGLHFNRSAKNLVGRTETILEGTTQGVTDNIYNFLCGLKSQNFFHNARKAISENVETNKREVQKINDQIEKEREKLLIKYSKLEREIAKANNLMMGIKALMQAEKK